MDYKQILKQKHPDLYRIVKAMAEGDSGGFSASPQPSQPSDAPLATDPVQVPQAPKTEKSGVELYNVSIEGRISFNVETEALDINDAKLLAPGVAIDVMKDVLAEINQKYKSHGIAVDRLRSVEAREVKLKDED